jgi:hypothetical protein
VIHDALLPYRVAGAYFESCNCDAICPCRRVGGAPGGRSTHGICYGVLTWQIETGHAGPVDLGGLNAALVCRYDDDETGSPWLFRLHVDERGDEAQRDALVAIVTGVLGGELVKALPWVRKPSELVDVRASRIEIDHGDGHAVRVGDSVLVLATRPFETDQTVTCVIPGHHVLGTEYVADELRVDEAPFAWELEATCAFATTFDYRSD